MEDEPDTDAIATGAGLIDMAFSKKRANERKQWLNSIDKDTYLNYSEAQKHGVNYSDFVNRELALYSQYDNIRSIPHIMDGLKPSQRKILFSCFKKKIKNEIKVAQLAGYIGEHSAYHHGEASLAGAIIGMAQSYVGSNNVNLLYPSGQFGTRRMGGKDHASARYIFTRLEKITRAIFHPDDDALLNYLNDDGISIEPEYYMPVIPLVLVNGSDGIGTGWSSTVLNHDPREVIENLKKMINDEEPEMIHPCYYGFKGDITISTEGKYIVTGKIERTDNNTLVISELPIGKWTQDYKSFLEDMMKTGTDKTGEITDFKEHHTDTTVAFTITAPKEAIDTFEKGKDGLVGKFKLAVSLSSTNNVDGKIHKYQTTLDILRSFFSHRLEFYVKRKDMLLDKMRKELKVLKNKSRFIEEVCEGDLVVSNRKRAELLSELRERGYDLCPKDDKMKSEEDDDEEDETMEESSSDSELAKGYEYLLGLKLWTLTFERAEDIRRQKADKEAEVAALEATTPESIWLSDLDELDEALEERKKTLAIETKKAVRSESQSTSKKRATKQAKAVATKATKPKPKNKADDEWNSDLEESESDGAAGSDSDDDFFENDDFVQKSESPPKKSKSSSSKSSLRLSGSVKQKVVLGTRTQQRKRISISKAKATVTKKEMLQVDSEIDDESPKKMPAEKKAARKKSSSIVKQALQAEVELVDSDESPKKLPARRKKSSLATKDSDSESDESTPKPSSKKATKAKKKSTLEKSICHLSSGDESDGYESHGDMSIDEPAATARGRKSLSKPKYTSAESDEDNMSVDEPAASARGRKRLSKPKYTFAESDEDDFEF